MISYTLIIIILTSFLSYLTQKKTVSCKIVRFRHSAVHLEVMEGLLLCTNAPDVPNNRNVKKYLLSKLQHNGFFILYSSFFIKYIGYSPMNNRDFPLIT